MRDTGAEPPRIWVVDATFLWGISSVDLVDVVLEHARGRLRVTETVYQELSRRAPQRPFLRRPTAEIEGGAIERITLTNAEKRLTFSLHSSLWQQSPKSGKDLGESETIAVAGIRGWNAVIDEKKARNVLPLRFPQSECYCTPQVVLALAEAGRLSMDDAYAKLQAMTRAPNFQHEFAGKPRGKWSNARAFYGPVRF